MFATNQRKAMASTKFFLDTRATKGATPSPLKIQITHKRKVCYLSTGVKLLQEQWDNILCKVVIHPQKASINQNLSALKARIDVAILEIMSDPKNFKLSAKDILDRLKGNDNAGAGTFYTRFIEYMDSRRAPGTRGVYQQTLSRMRAFDSDIEKRTFEDIDRRWLERFEEYLSITAKSANARSIHFRNIRAVFNDALDDELTACYPFRKFKIHSQPTAKRSLTVEQLRMLMNYPCEEHQKKYVDIFILMFMLCGINAKDLFNAQKGAIINGRLEYVRAKTSKQYSVKVEPEAMRILKKYEGKKYLLNVMDNRLNYEDFLHKMDRELKKIGPYVRAGRGGKKIYSPLFPNLSQYWCRHTWATLAAELDIPKETIAAGLGHSDNSVTDIYIRFNYKKVDEANRRIIDYFLHDKKEDESGF